MAAHKQWNNLPGHWQKRQKPLARAMRKVPTEAEARLWQSLRGRQVGGLHFRRQHPVGPYIVDFFCVAVQLAIEIDGAIHDHRDQAAYDLNRTEALGQAGIRILRFTNADVLERLEWVLRQIHESAAAR
jgi:very-short-patch-repair endonuclease